MARLGRRFSPFHFRVAAAAAAATAVGGGGVPRHRRTSLTTPLSIVGQIEEKKKHLLA